MSAELFRAAEQEYLRLKDELSAGRISVTQFHQALIQSKIGDPLGRPWSIGARSGRWYFFDGAAWVQADPYRTLRYIHAAQPSEEEKAPEEARPGSPAEAAGRRAPISEAERIDAKRSLEGLLGASAPQGQEPLSAGETSSRGPGGGEPPPVQPAPPPAAPGESGGTEKEPAEQAVQEPHAPRVQELGSEPPLDSQTAAGGEPAPIPGAGPPPDAEPFWQSVPPAAAVSESLPTVPQPPASGDKTAKETGRRGISPSLSLMSFALGGLLCLLILLGVLLAANLGLVQIGFLPTITPVGAGGARPATSIPTLIATPASTVPPANRVNLFGALVTLSDLPPGFDVMLLPEREKMGIDVLARPDVVRGFVNARLLNSYAFIDRDSGQPEMVFGYMLYPLTPAEVAAADRVLAQPQELAQVIGSVVRDQEETPLRFQALTGRVANTESSAQLMTSLGTVNPKNRAEIALARQGAGLLYAAVVYGEESQPQVSLDQVASLVASRMQESPIDHWTAAFSESFDSNVSGWFTGTSDNEYGVEMAQFLTGKYRWELQAKQDHVSFDSQPQTGAFSDFAVSVDIQRASSVGLAAAGILFRSADRNNNNAFIVSDADQAYGVYALVNANSTTLLQGTDRAAIRPGVVNRLSIIAQGPHLAFFVNDEYVGEVEDDTYRSGNLGVVAVLERTGDKAVLDLDNFQVRVP